jgi:hypothetical protein
MNHETDTPRTDASKYSTGIIDLSRQLERELAASKAEVERLREALDTLTAVVGLTPVLGNKEALQEAFDHARKAINPTDNPNNKPT